MKRSLIFILSITLLVGFSIPAYTHAATTSSSGSLLYDLNLDSTPSFPGPNQQVTITATSYSFDINRSTLNWYVDDTSFDSGTGKSSITITSPALGGIKRIRLEFIAPNGMVFNREKVIRSADIDLLWEPVNSYAPPFYKGKTLVSSESQIRFVAIPVIPSISAVGRGDGFIFNWQNGDQNDADASGISKDAYTITNSYLHDTEDIGINATGTQTNFSAGTQESVSTVNPLVYFYDQDPLLGTDYSHALTDQFTMTGKETTLVASPYFLSPNNFSGDAVSFTWTVNGDTITTPSTKNQLVIRNESGKEGDVSIGLDIKSVYKLFGEVAKSLTVTLIK